MTYLNAYKIDKIIYITFWTIKNKKVLSIILKMQITNKEKEAIVVYMSKNSPLNTLEIPKEHESNFNEESKCFSGIPRANVLISKKNFFKTLLGAFLSSRKHSKIFRLYDLFKLMENFYGISRVDMLRFFISTIGENNIDVMNQFPLIIPFETRNLVKELK